ncbi:MAG: cytochrome ubiquinol oxidase subunit I [Woeseiaceae bacterium]|nr:cytochrome ubiquinol oxidase subunit I [Woeseiaceae bacterium]
MDALALARVQFAANITFHILFPAITMGLAWLLVYFKTKHDRTGLAHWLDAYRFWVKVFALSFALGVVSGITMSFQFGTNWPGFMETVGNIAGPLLGYEVLTAFFLEATFLGIMLFGRKRVSNRVHTFSTWMVAIGTSMSAFWILALNSWMQTPTGFEMRDGQAFPLSWIEVIFSPSMPYRLVHMLLASGLTAAFVVAGLSAYRHLRGDRSDANRAALRVGAWVAAILIPVQIVAGDLHGLNTLEHQPAKVAAMEGLWEDMEGAPLLLFAWPDEGARENHFEIGIPKLASLILTHELDGEVRGLNSFEGEHPPVAPVFFAFRIMVGVGLLMLIVSWVSVWAMRRNREPSKWLARTLVGMTFSGWVATVAGWYVSEIGRQPWLVHGVLRTAEAVGPVSAGPISVSLATYLAVYAVLLGAYVSVVFYLASQAAGGRIPRERERLDNPLHAAEAG